MPPQLPPPVPPSLPNGMVTICYAGYWAAIDWPINISVNGVHVNTISFLKECDFSVPVQPGRVHIHAKLSIRSADLVLDVQPGMHYYVSLVYNRFWGSISLILAKM